MEACQFAIRWKLFCLHIICYVSMQISAHWCKKYVIIARYDNIYFLFFNYLHCFISQEKLDIYIIDCERMTFLSQPREEIAEQKTGYAITAILSTNSICDQLSLFVAVFKTRDWNWKMYIVFLSFNNRGDCGITSI